LAPVYSTYATVTPSTLKEMETNEKVFKLEYIMEPLENKNLFKSHDKYLQEVENIMGKLNKNYIYTHIANESLKKSINNNFTQLKLTSSYHHVEKEVGSIKKKLMKIKFNVYGVYLQDTQFYINFLKSHELYWADTLVKKRLLQNTSIFFELFAKISEETLFVVKGVQDFIAFNNTIKLLGYEYTPNFNNLYDIETFNGLSNNLYLSSQLEVTYKNIIKTKIYRQFVKKIFDHISKNIGDKAHNPVVDSLFTIIIAVTINIGLNDYFKNQ
jgi:hypothetical protein